MAVTTEDVAEAVKAIWDANATLSNPTTGLVKSLILGRVPDAPATPYTSFKVTDGDTQRNASTSYLQTFVVEFKTWASAVGCGPIKLAIEAAFVIRKRTVMTLPNTRNLAILHCLKMPGGLDEDEQTIKGMSVKVTTDKFEILTQG